MKSVIKPIRAFAVLFAVAAAILVAPLSVAVGNVHAQASVAQSYATDEPLQAGMVVRLADDESKVAPVSQDKADDIYGVVVRANDTPLSLSEGTGDQQIYVATSGNYQVLVSDQNGPIKQGDYIVVSAIEGIGMKVDSSSEFVVGKALSDFDSSGTVLSKTSVKDTAGNEQSVNIGYIQADININRNPTHKGTEANVPGILQKAADAVANKSVTAVRVYLSVAVVVLVSIVACSILYAGIKTSMIALGRNPLARKSIFRNLFRIITVAFIILIAGLSTVYLILKL